MSPTRRTFLKQLGLGAAALTFWTPSSRNAWGATAQQLPRSTPEAEGISSAGIQAFLDAIAGSNHELHSIMVARHGRVVAEGWWAPYGPEFRHTMYSMSKSFTSTAVGLAVAEGKLSVEDRVVSFFPKDLPENPGEFLDSLKIKHLLTMSVGNEKEPTSNMVQQENWVRAFLASPITHPPGSTFLYNTGATYMCSAIVQQVTGQKLVDYLTPRLFAPLGIEGATWETCPRGINTGGYGLSIPTEAMLKFGQLYLQKGQWEGRELLPAKWVEEATSFKIQQPDKTKPARLKEEDDWLQGYCYQFWRCRHNAFRGDGAYGQFTIVMPEQDAVVAITAETSNMQDEIDLVWNHLFTAMKPSALPADPAAHDRLQKTLSALALRPPQTQPASPIAARVTDKSFKLEANDLGLQSVRFSFSSHSCVVTFNDASSQHPISCGLEQWRRGETDLPGTPPRLVSGGAPPPGTLHKVAASGTWKDEQTFEMTWRYYETPHHDTVTCRFDAGNKVEIAFVNSMASMSGKTSDKRPTLKGQVG